MNKNYATLTGIITEAPARIGDKGLRVTIAGVTRPRTEGSQGQTFYHETNIWGGLADRIGDYLQAGVPIMVQGELRQRTYSVNDDGAKREQVSISAQSIQFLDPTSVNSIKDKRDQSRMLNALNEVHLEGRLVSEPTFRETEKGTPVVNARIAVNQEYQSNGDTRSYTNFINLTAWGDDAILLSGQTKGQRIYVEGTFNEDNYERNGEKRYTQFVNVNKVAVLARSLEDAAPVSDGAFIPSSDTSNDIPADLPF